MIDLATQPAKTRFEAPPFTLSDPELERFYRYWQDKRGARPMPSRTEFDPLEIPYILGHVILVDVLDSPRRFHIRVHRHRDRAPRRL